MAVAVVGMSLGYQSCYVAVARGGGIETVANEYSDRATPTCISFNSTTRSVGASAKQQQITNVKNTFFGFTKLLGQRFSDTQVQNEIKNFPFQIIQKNDDLIGVVCNNYLGEQSIFSPEQLVAMQLSKLKEIAENNLRTKVVDVVLNVPASTDDFGRRALIDSAQIAGLNCIRVVNDITASSIAYGIYNRDFPPPDQPSSNVVIIDFGASNLQVAVVAFNQGKMVVLSSVCDSELGGRDFDRIIFNHFLKTSMDKYKLDVKSNAKASIRLLQECEKLKKLMSANSTRIPINIECFMNDVDVSFDMDRTEFESISASLFQRIENVIKAALLECGLSAENISSVEIVGGSSRMTKFKEIVNNVFKQDPRTTLNADESVARGASLQCAILSPAFKVKDFFISDLCQYGITLVYTEPGKQQAVNMEVFPRRHAFPASKQFSLQRNGEFDIAAYYSHDKRLIGTFSISGVPVSPNGDLSTLRVKLRLNVHGIFSVYQVQLIEKIEKVVPVEEAPAQPAAQEAAPPVTTDPNNTDSKNEVQEDVTHTNNMDVTENNKKSEPLTTVKIFNKYTDLTLIGKINLALDQSTVVEYTENENRMQAQDRLERERMTAKNSVEEYVYEMREKLFGQYEAFASESERDQFSSELSSAEDWLYNEGEDVNKQNYIDRLTGLRAVGDKIKSRYVEAEIRPRLIQDFNQLYLNIENAIKSYCAREGTYDHIEQSKIEQMKSELCASQKWLNEQLNIQNQKKQHEDVVLTVDVLRTHYLALDSSAKSIFNTPKPKVEPPIEPVNDQNQQKSPQSNSQSEHPLNGDVVKEMDID